MMKELANKKRVLIVGCAGAGKSLLTRELSKRLKLPSVYLDHLYWTPNWQACLDAEFDDKLQLELEKDSWIMDGAYLPTLSQSLKYADCVVFLDFNRWLCAWRCIKRWLFDDKEQASGCSQKMDVAFLKYILWRFPRKNRKMLIEAIKSDCECDEFIHLKSPQELKQWLLLSG